MSERRRTATLVIRADLKEVHRVSEAIENAMQSGGFPEEAILDLQLAAEESVVNTIVHGYRGTEGEVSVHIEVNSQSIRVRIEDHAPRFDPLSLPVPDMETDLAERPVGGLGIFLMRQMVDEAHYQYLDGKNILTLIKVRPA